MGDGFYRSKDPTNSIKVLKEQLLLMTNRKSHMGFRLTSKSMTSAGDTITIQKATIRYSIKWVKRGPTQRGDGLDGWTVRGGGFTTNVVYNYKTLSTSQARSHCLLNKFIQQPYNNSQFSTRDTCEVRTTANPLKPTIAIWVQLYGILCHTGSSHL